jgi:hypothetical protein
MDFGEKGWHAHARDDVVEAPAEDWRDSEPVLGDGGIGDRVCDRGGRQRFQLRIEGCRALGAPGDEAVRHGQAEPPFGPHQFEGRPRQQIILEATPSTAAFDPDVAGAQPVAQMHENGDLPGPGIEAAGALADETPPLARQEGKRHLARQPLAAVYIAQQVDGGEQRILGANERKVKTLKASFATRRSDFCRSTNSSKPLPWAGRIASSASAMLALSPFQPSVQATATARSTPVL